MKTVAVVKHSKLCNSPKSDLYAFFGGYQEPNAYRNLSTALSFANTVLTFFHIYYCQISQKFKEFVFTVFVQKRKKLMQSIFYWLIKKLSFVLNIRNDHWTKIVRGENFQTEHGKISIKKHRILIAF